MAENLPLIPEKRNSLCADVRSVLRDVFRETDYLPPRRDRVDAHGDTRSDPVDELSSEYKEVAAQEEALKLEFAKRTAREPLPNIYKLYSPVDTHEENWKSKHGLVGRSDLKPSIEQDAGRNVNLWIKNILNRSSGDLKVEKEILLPPHIIAPCIANDKTSLYSVSLGELISRPSLRPQIASPLPSEPEYILCVPTQLEFINFTVGQLHTQTLRLVNVTKFDVRLSVRPPERRELDVELCSRLVVTSGSAAELRVHFRPRDVREIRIKLLVRASAGKSLKVPINCYMQPPILEILVPSISSRSASIVDSYNVCDVIDLGSKLLGDVHRAPLIFYTETNHATFFLLSEDAWIDFAIDMSQIKNAKAKGEPVGAASDRFWITPAYWFGGRAVEGSAVCRANTRGVHTTLFRILCSTAIVRSLHLVADTLLFKPDHVTLQAQEKDYDICSADDQGCEHYVHLGVAFPGRSLAARVKVINHSPVAYDYYWSSRRWGICSCWDTVGDSETVLGEDELCPKPPRQSNKEHGELTSFDNVRAVCARPARGQLAPRAVASVELQVSDVGRKLGVQRAVLMLVLKDIPKESFDAGIDPMIIKRNVVEEESVPGVYQGASKELCDMVVAQVEVWWEVAPVCFILDQPLLVLPRSRRIKSLTVPLLATQISGVVGVTASWKSPGAHLPRAIQLEPAKPILTNIQLPLTNLPDEYPETRIYQLVAENQEWVATTRVYTKCSTRQPALAPAAVWLGLAPPGARVQTQIKLSNDTYQHIYWWGSSWRWWHENLVGKACIGRAPCDKCCEDSCTCALMRPSRGALAQWEETFLNYDVHAPETDGCVATLLQVRRALPDLSRVPAGVGSEGRAALVAYRVLAPRLMLRVLPCADDEHSAQSFCEGCSVDKGCGHEGRGTCVLRPGAALTVGRRACFVLRCTNLTPLATSLRWETPLASGDSLAASHQLASVFPDGADVLRVTFIPECIEIGAHQAVELKTENRQVAVEPLRVCTRRVFVQRASVKHALDPKYLLIDTAVQGLEVNIEIPLGGDRQTDSFCIMRRSQKEDFPWEPHGYESFAPEHWFVEDDKKRNVQKENICRCKYKMVYVPPKKPVEKIEQLDNEHDIEIVTEAPPLTRVCPCTSCSKPVVPEQLEPLCLQFWNLPVRTVRTRVVRIRNLSTVTARWDTAVRRWPRHILRTQDVAVLKMFQNYLGVLTELPRRSRPAAQRASDIGEAGMNVQCQPSNGILMPRANAEISVSVFADCWGIYRDQILIRVEYLEPIIVDLWMEAIGSPLRFAIEHELAASPILWMSSSDPERHLKVTNVSPADLEVEAYVVQEHGHHRDALPFRLYIRFYDVPPRTCPCIYSLQSSIDLEEESGSPLPQEMDTAVELFLEADFGIQAYDHYLIEPAETIIPKGNNVSWRVCLHPTPDPVPPCALLLRVKPVLRAGGDWFRPAPPPRPVLLRAVPRRAALQLSRAEVRVAVCALVLPLDDVVRIRKSLQVQNVGGGHLTCCLDTAPPWRTVAPRAGCRAHCGAGPAQRADVGQLDLPPHASVQLSTEVSLHTRDVWPHDGEVYPSRLLTTTPLNIRDENDVTLASLPLILEIDLPIIHATPPNLDFGYVTDGDTRKNYITITHSSRTAAMDLVTKLEGSQDFQVWPCSVVVEAGASKIIYVQYTARWRCSPTDAQVVISAAGGAGRWCTVAVPVRARPTRDFVYHKPPHDNTDDVILLPKDIV